MPTYSLNILTPEGKAYESEVHSVIAPGMEGFFGVLANHTPMIAAVRVGVLTVREETQTHFFVLGEGLLEVSSEGVSVLADTAERADSEEAAKKRAKEIETELAATTAV